MVTVVIFFGIFLREMEQFQIFLKIDPQINWKVFFVIHTRDPMKMTTFPFPLSLQEGEFLEEIIVKAFLHVQVDKASVTV